MSKNFLVLALISSALNLAAARLHSLPEDPHAFPKFKVTFLNNLPVLNETAQKWLSQGIPGEIDDGGFGESGSSSPVLPESHIPYSLEQMKMGPRDSYLCLVPRPLEFSSSTSDVDSDEEITPARSWSLLQPLSGTCLYHRQGWFTYSYCHNDQIRQFRELPQAHSHMPEEDHSWESYTLGKAPPAPEPGADLTVAEQNAIEANLELARGAGSRYLVQRWGDGTICDKTGKGREVEVQFHCSMTMSDTILLVKETRTCAYVLIINTPRLCGEPGFRSQHDFVEQAQIRCREIVHTQSEEFHDVPETDYPQKIPRIKKALPPKSAEKFEKSSGGVSTESILLKTLEAFFGENSNGQVVVQQVTDDGEMVIEFLDDLSDDGDDGEDVADKITNVLRAAGYNIKGEERNKQTTPGDSDKKRQDRSSDSSSSEKQAALQEQVRDEL
ncbi:misfolded glycoproteins degradation protein [Lentinula edodes]|uniref:Protein OS-9 homolog n=1 Tax=Lentinula edodes TaxID=5353 RepID=A0A1Q3EMQ8_LENED|nr:misfolded glycoproteins degradation protein [Lentinula edodes]